MAQRYYEIPLCRFQFYKHITTDYSAGTSSEDSVFAPYLSVIGISSWDQIYNDL